VKREVRDAKIKTTLAPVRSLNQGAKARNENRIRSYFILCGFVSSLAAFALEAF
jgi:hypothetical protein